jgi:lysyl endopeptidase
VMGPYPANEIAETTKKVGEWWSPVLEGSSATIEIAVSASVDVANATLTVSRVSHLMRAGAELAPAAVAKATGIGTAGSCEINWQCETPTPALTSAANAVARMLYTKENGTTYLCSGTLLNNAAGTQTPYFFTANHCIDSVYAASTLNLYWFFGAVDCDNPTTPASYQLQSDGATLLGRSQAQDWVLLRLNSAPPAGTVLSAWSAVPIATGPVIALHHPHGDLLKYSAGALVGYTYAQITDDNDAQDALDVMATAVFSQGAVEAGSSGSGLLTYNAGNTATGPFYEVRGGFSGGQLTCDAKTSPNYYSRLDQMLPKMRDYLAPGTNAPKEAVVVEFYNKSHDH